MSQELKFDALRARLKDELSATLEARAISDPVMVGVQTGGVIVAEWLHRELRLSQPLSSLNINFYRDDFSRLGLHPQVGRSDLKTSLDDKHVVLVDDVLHTGRTVRAALNELFDYGRPASVILAILITRNGRELPVQPDACGASIELDAGLNIKLQPDTRSIDIV